MECIVCALSACFVGIIEVVLVGTVYRSSSGRNSRVPGVCSSSQFVPCFVMLRRHGLYSSE